MSDYVPQLKKILRAAGCCFVRQGKGSHEIWRSPTTGKSFPVQKTMKSRHTANVVLKQAGIEKKF